MAQHKQHIPQAQRAPAPQPGHEPDTHAADSSATAAEGLVPGDVAQRHASLLHDPRLLQSSSAARRAGVMRSLQRGYGNGHVARLLAQRRADTGAPRADDQQPAGPAADISPIATSATAPAAEPADAAVPAPESGASPAAADAQTSTTTAPPAPAALAASAPGAEPAGAAAPSAGPVAPAAQENSSPAATAQPWAGSAGADQAGPKPAPAQLPAAAGQSDTAGTSDTPPASAAADPAFQSVQAQVGATAAQEQSHPPAAGKAGEAQAAAESPAAERQGMAQANQVGEMGQAPTPDFDAADFKAKLMQRIKDTAPKNQEEADEFEESGKLDGVRGEMQGQVKQEQDQSAEPMEQAAEASPDPSAVPEKPVTPLPPANPGAAPAPINAAGAAPKPLGPSQVEAPIAAESQRVDQQMAEAGVTDEQLARSNEPSFQDALQAKNDAKKEAAQAPQTFRQAEQDQLGKARADANQAAQAGLGAMHGERAGAFGKVAGQQGKAKGADEQARANVAADIQKIYAETKTSVTGILDGLDKKVTDLFDRGAAAAQHSFERFVDMRMKAYKDQRYGGWDGLALWIKDKCTSMPDEVNTFYVEGRNKYLADMDRVIDGVVALVGGELKRAKDEVAKGKQRIKEYVDTLPANLKSVGQQAADDIQGQFDELSQSIQNKQGDLINTLAEKYNEKLQTIDSRIKELKEANKGLIDRVVDAVGGVIKQIIEIKNMLMGVLAQAAGVIGKIIDDPSGFVGNLIDAVGQGLQGFVSRIGDHLKRGLMTWLFGEMAKNGLEMPASFDLKGILHLVAQLLGLTWDNIKARAEKILGPKVVGVLMGSFEIFKILQGQGLAGLWEYIKDKIGDLKEQVIEQVKGMVIKEVIEAGVKFMAPLLAGPFGALLIAARTIYNIVTWVLNNGKQIISFVQSIIDAVGAIAGGSLGQAAQAVENALAKSIPVVIGFLAGLLNLGDLGNKVRGIIQKIQQPFNKAIDWVLGKAKSFAKTLMKGAGKLLGRDKPETEAQKQQRLQKGVNAGVASVNKLKGTVVTKAAINPVLAAIRMRYRLGVLEPVVQDGMWAVHGEINRIVGKTGVYCESKDLRARNKPNDDKGTWVGRTFYSNDPKIKSKYPNGVTYNIQGYPDFTPYAKIQVRIKMTGKNTDFNLANKAANLEETPDGYVWHHHQDRTTMQLVPKDIHSRKATPHTGGRAVINEKGTL
ncbi:MAG TPA: HNH endonuclease [Roseiflexaceae bacterium]|nr:HNH endonuclease [Roseiflexaceae bacterium]